ncbi:uncharacterized protein FOMMEDRAFT_157150 [Fomitiporia mediterranea MF3/22]|uniref:uncharacterized protein n=1 Tax=Fomitiporia mediterranea (strain MF3/22) TaxID=694068 RepID=UPI0004408FB1|nr:uncharacterized protein FOMMEDRAFT_157150 [Fomitiporia mediterranea MF3/22]EJD01983.1 hypothetical protein FOMMEDRAFT_157150 [Fomitiporia mediterranea MF3/22]
MALKSVESSSAWHKISQMPELLSLIFIFSLPMHNMMPSEHAAPMLLTRICRHWRSLALSTPQLWSRLRLKIPLDQNDEAETLRTLQKFSRILQTYLSRSGKVGISLDIDLSPLYEGQAAVGVEHRELVSPLISSILPYSHQWRHLSITAPLQYLTPIMDLVSSGSAPNVESLTLDFSCDSIFPDFGMNESELLPFSVMLNAAPANCLKSLTIYGNADVRVILCCDLGNLSKSLSHVMFWNVHLEVNANHETQLQPATSPMNSLRRLFLAALITSNDLIQTLRASPELVELTLDVELRADDLANGFDHMVELVHLRKLRINVGESTSKILGKLQLPSLAFLEFTTDEGPEVRGVLPEVTSLLQRSNPPLIFCMICDGYGNVREEELIEFLWNAKQLEELRVIKKGLSNRVLKALTVKDISSVSGVEAEPGGSSSVTDAKEPDGNANLGECRLCPRLFSVTFTAGNEFSPQAIIDLIVSRCPARMYRSEELQPLLSSDDFSSASPCIRSNSQVQGSSNGVEFGSPVSVSPAQEIRTLKMFQAVVEHSNVVTENDTVRQCIDEGLKLHLRDPSSFIPVFI